MSPGELCSTTVEPLGSHLSDTISDIYLSLKDKHQKQLPVTRAGFHLPATA